MTSSSKARRGRIVDDLNKFDLQEKFPNVANVTDTNPLSPAPMMESTSHNDGSISRKGKRRVEV